MDSFDSTFDYYNNINEQLLSAQEITSPQPNSWTSWENSFDENNFPTAQRSHANARERYRTHR